MRRPRNRECLLKGCGKRFRPKHPMTRYCSEECGQEARQWSQSKSQQRYRQSRNGRQKRQKQSERYRKQARVRTQANREEGARGVIPIEFIENIFSAMAVIVRAAM